MSSRWAETRNRMVVPLVAALFFGTILYVFRHVLLPFIMALVIVYLMEPAVRRLTGLKVHTHTLPRWSAVVLVYLTFFTTVTVFFLLAIPPLTQEMGKAAEEIPGYLNDLREQYLPEWSRQLEETFGLASEHDPVDREDLRKAITHARVQLGDAHAQAFRVQYIDELPVVDHSGAQALLRVGEDRAVVMAPVAGRLDSMSVLFGGSGEFDADRVAFTVVRDPRTEGFAFLVGENEMHVVPSEDGSYLVRFEPRSAREDLERFSLEREIVRGLTGIVESGSEYAVDLLSLVQTLLGFVFNAFIMIILTFMVAAFMSIDLPRIMAFFRSLVPELWHDAYDELVGRLNRGLSGVIRGQLVICVINGVLTGLGLWILGVDFALMLGVIAGVLSIIPIFGTIISTIPAVLMGLMQGASVAVLVFAWIMLVHFIDANFMTPKIVGRSSELHPVVIIFALLAGEHTFGLVGALLAVAVASIVQTLFVFLLSRVRRSDVAHEFEAHPPLAPTEPETESP